MKRSRLLLITASLTALLITGVTFTVLSQKQPEKPVYVAYKVDTVQLNADTIFELVNAERVKAGVKPLIRDARLDISASAKCIDMLKDNYFAHEDPTTGDVWNYIKVVKPDYKTAGENLGVSDEGDSTVVVGWMNSESHKINIIAEKYNNTGLATCYSPTYETSGHSNVWLVVQHFTN